MMMAKVFLSRGIREGCTGMLPARMRSHRALKSSLGVSMVGSEIWRLSWALSPDMDTSPDTAKDGMTKDDSS